MSITKASLIDLNGQELILDADADTSITADTDDRIDIKIAGSDTVHITSTGLGVGTNAPGQLLVLDAGSGDVFQRFDKSGTIKGLIGVADSATNGSSLSVQGDMIVRGQTNLLFDTAGTTRAAFDSSGNFVFNENGNDSDFCVYGDSNANILVVDSVNDRVGVV